MGNNAKKIKKQKHKNIKKGRIINSHKQKEREIEREKKKREREREREIKRGLRE